MASWQVLDMAAEAQEKIQPPVQRRDELDQEYDALASGKRHTYPYIYHYIHMTALRYG